MTIFIFFYLSNKVKFSAYSWPKDFSISQKSKVKGKDSILVKMEKRVIQLCALAGFLGLLSVATGFAAEGTKLRKSQVQFVPPDSCRSPRTPAYALGITSAWALLFVQVLISCETGCLCCRRVSRPASSSTTTSATICFILSWLFFLFAFVMLEVGAVLNNSRGEIFYSNLYSSCPVLPTGIFSGGAILSLAAIALMMTHYLILNAAKNVNENQAAYTGGVGIAMAQPQFPPQHQQPATTEGPVFVHEDTYMRRQFT